MKIRLPMMLANHIIPVFVTTASEVGGVSLGDALGAGIVGAPVGTFDGAGVTAAVVMTAYIDAKADS